MMNHQFLFNNLGNSHFFPCFFFPLKLDQTLQIVWSGSGQGNIFFIYNSKEKKKTLGSLFSDILQKCGNFTRRKEYLQESHCCPGCQ